MAGVTDYIIFLLKSNDNTNFWSWIHQENTAKQLVTLDTFDSTGSSESTTIVNSKSNQQRENKVDPLSMLREIYLDQNSKVITLLGPPTLTDAGKVELEIIEVHRWYVACRTLTSSPMKSLINDNKSLAICI